MKFKSKHEHTISFTASSFAKLLDTQWDTINCTMRSGRVIVLPRHQLVRSWAITRDWRRVPYSSVMVKVIKVD